MMPVGGSKQFPDHLHEKLIHGASKCATFLTNLTNEQETANGVRKPAMPKTAFKNVKALAFVFVKRWGLIGGCTYDFGFITRRLVAEDGTVTWSAPLFTRGLQFSLGITIGSMKCGVCYALMNEEAIQNLLSSRIKPKFGAEFLVDMNGAAIRKTHIDSSWSDDNVVSDGRGGLLAKYFRLEAMLVDLSIRLGKLGLYTKMNKGIYGDKVTPDDVLSGRIPRPVEFFTVYEILNKCTASARPALKASASIKGMASRFQLTDRSERGLPLHGSGNLDGSVDLGSGSNDGASTAGASTSNVPRLAYSPTKSSIVVSDGGGPGFSGPSSPTGSNAAGGVVSANNNKAVGNGHYDNSGSISFNLISAHSAGGIVSTNTAGGGGGEGLALGSSESAVRRSSGWTFDD